MTNMLLTCPQSRLEELLGPSWPQLRERFGIQALRPGQAEALGALREGRDALAVMPTGSGKSLIFQMAAQWQSGITLVISPLIALMVDQVESLRRRGIPASLIHSGQSERQREEAWQSVLQGQVRLLYLAPERLRNRRFREGLGRLRVSLLAVDEAHCISQWGHDFRPDYLALAGLRAELGHPQTVALTATATPEVQAEIERALELRSCARVVTGFDRPNLEFVTARVAGELDKLMHLGTRLDRCPGAALVYTGTRRSAEEVASWLSASRSRPILAYHAGLKAGVRQQVQQAFLREPGVVVVATNAFGMGIDRPDLRLVMHHTLPGSLEAYYQEAGRAGRDGAPARALLLYHPKDVELHHYFIRQGALSALEYRAVLARVEAGSVRENLDRVGLDHLQRAGFLARQKSGWRVLQPWSEAAAGPLLEHSQRLRRQRLQQLQTMVAYAETKGCRRRALVGYFGEEAAPRPGSCCDNC